MVELTDAEEKLLSRYLKLGHQEDRFVLFEASRKASNRLLDLAEARYPKEDPTDYHLTYLQGINRRRSNNYRKLIGIRDLVRVIRTMKTKTLDDLGMGAGS